MSTCLCFRNYQCLSCEAGIRRETRAANPTRPRSMAGTARKVAECGTRAGYNRHIKQGEPTCTACKAAQNAGVKKYQREKAMANG
jgi:hypothetical protein